MGQVRIFLYYIESLFLKFVLKVSLFLINRGGKRNEVD